MSLEDRIAAIVKDAYASDGYEDEGRSDGAAHEIISILRQPTEEMLDAVYKTRISCIRNHDVSEDDLKKIFAVMIDAALSPNYYSRNSIDTPTVEA